MLRNIVTARNGCWAVLALMLATGGCRLREEIIFTSDDLAHYQQQSSQAVFNDAELLQQDQLPSYLPPWTIDDSRPPEYWNLTLQEALRLALTNSRLLHDLGGTVLRSPEQSVTIHNPAIQETDPNFGPEAALSDFDAQFTTTALFEKNDRALNNLFRSGGAQLLRQDFAVVHSELKKTAATGGQFSLRQEIDYDSNNALGNRFPHAWNWNVEAEIRHPLLRGAGTEFNRIAGPNGTPGWSNGVLIARLNSEVELAEFQINIRDFVSNVENAYWDLYFAYRDLDAKLAARDASLEIWQRIRTLQQARRSGGEAENEARAREQYYRFHGELQESLTGRSVEPTRTRNGSTGGTFHGSPGVQLAERRLRLLMGTDLSDGRLIRPVEEPSTARVLFDWNELTNEALFRRAELERQRRMVKRRELECIASRNFLKPQLDLIGTYRWRGFGKDLMGSGSDVDFPDALSTLVNGDLQEWALGMELSYPNGFRRAHAGVRNAVLRLARERTILEQQQRQIVHDLGCAYADMKRAYAIAQTNYNRRVAAQQQLDALRLKDREGQKVDLEQLLESWRRLTDADIQLHRSLVEYVLSVKNVHFEKGSLLDYNEVFFAEEQLPTELPLEQHLPMPTNRLPEANPAEIPLTPPMNN